MFKMVKLKDLDLRSAGIEKGAFLVDQASTGTRNPL